MVIVQKKIKIRFYSKRFIFFCTTLFPILVLLLLDMQNIRHSGSEDEDGAALFVAQVEEELANAEGASLHPQGASLHLALEHQRNRGHLLTISRTLKINNFYCPNFQQKKFGLYNQLRVQQKNNNLSSLI